MTKKELVEALAPFNEDDKIAIEATGAVIDDDGVACDACGFGIRLVDLCVVDPDGLGPFHRECALACGFSPSLIRIAPDEFAVLDVEDFDEEAVKPERKN